MKRLGKHIYLLILFIYHPSYEETMKTYLFVDIIHLPSFLWRDYENISNCWYYSFTILLMKRLGKHIYLLILFIYHPSYEETMKTYLFVDIIHLPSFLWRDYENISNCWYYSFTILLMKRLWKHIYLLILFIYNPSYEETRKTYLFFDIIHLIKNVRNNFLNRKFLFPEFSYNLFRDEIHVPAGFISWNSLV